MNFTTENITNPVFVDEDRNVIEGTLPDGHKVRVSRHQHGWEVWLRISVDGITYHDVKADKSEQKFFNDLLELTFKIKDENLNARRSVAMSCASQFLIKW